MIPRRFLVYIYLLLEIAVFAMVVSWIGVLGTLFLVVMTTFVGMMVLRAQQVSIMRCMQDGFCGLSGKPLFNLMGHSVTMLGGILLALPGFLTDIAGLFCLIPYCRGWLSRLFVRFKTGQHPSNDAHIIEGQCWHEGEIPPEEDRS